MSVFLSPIGNDAPFYANGVALVGGQLFTYLAGSSTLQTTYSDNTGLPGVANANPILLNSAGYPAAGGNRVEIWLTGGLAYKFVLEDAANNVLWTMDNISGINDTSVTVSEWTAAPAPTYVSGTSFTFNGDQTAAGLADVGRRIKATVTAGTVYGRISAASYSGGTLKTTVTVVLDSGALDAGLSAVSYGLLSAVNPSYPLIDDSRVVLENHSDTTKLGKFDLSSIPTGITRTLPFAIPPNPQAADYPVVAGDYGKFIKFVGTLTLPSPVVLGSGFWFIAKNGGTGVGTAVTTSTAYAIRAPGITQGGGTSMTLPYSGTSVGMYNVSGGMFVSDGTAAWEMVSTIETHGQTPFIGAGTATWTCPAGVNTAFYTGCGGGAGGGNSSGANTGGGGGGGASCVDLPVAVVPGTGYPVVNGAGGAAGNPGANGGASSFGGVTLNGGTGGVQNSTGGAGGAAGAGQIAGGAGGNGGATTAGGTSGGASVFGACADSTGGGAAAVVGGGAGAGGGGGNNGAGGAAGSAGFGVIRW